MTRARGHAPGLSDAAFTRRPLGTLSSATGAGLLLVQQPILEPGALDQTPYGRRRLADAEPDTCFLGGSAGDQQGSQG